MCTSPYHHTSPVALPSHSITLLVTCLPLCNENLLLCYIFLDVFILILFVYTKGFTTGHPNPSMYSCAYNRFNLIRINDGWEDAVEELFRTFLFCLWCIKNNHEKRFWFEWTVSFYMSALDKLTGLQIYVEVRSVVVHARKRLKWIPVVTRIQYVYYLYFCLYSLGLRLIEYHSVGIRL